MKAVLFVGRRERTARCLLEACRDGSLGMEICCVVSYADAAGAAVGRSLGFPVVVLGTDGLEREAYDRLLAQRAAACGTTVVVLAEYMRLLSGWFVRNHTVLNLHPSLLPRFPGMDARVYAAVLQAGVSVSGCTVCIVDEGMDTGRILASAEVPVLADDTVESLRQRTLSVGAPFYVGVLRDFAAGKFD